MARSRIKRIRPILDILCAWQTGSKYPDSVKVAMRNGVVQTYLLDSKAERICTGPGGWERTGDQRIGYQYTKMPLYELQFRQRLHG